LAGTPTVATKVKANYGKQIPAFPLNYQAVPVKIDFRSHHGGLQAHRHLKILIQIRHTQLAMTSAFSDKELINGCLAGNEAASEAFVRRFSRLVYSSIQGVIKSKGACISQQDVEDLHNTVFVSFFEKKGRKLRMFEGRNGCSLASWVRMITVRAVLDFLRRRRDPLSRQERLTPLELAPEPADSAQAPAWACMVAKEQRALIEKGLQGLKTRDQLIIQLHCLEERPLAQVAVILNVSGTGIHSVKHRAIKRLKENVRQLMKKSTTDAITP
jgi:RNA polymerase sigma factor (sigma-70 family)